MNLDYSAIFAQRGAAYHQAMLRCPHARDAEFEALFERTRPHAGQRVLDIPAGGGYLLPHLPSNIELQSLELSAGFAAGVPVYRPGAPWTFGRFDHGVCLAALHHIEDQTGFLATLLAQLAPAGTLHLADVARDSGVARFLDGFVGRYNVTGHNGCYLPQDRAWFATLGRITRHHTRSCAWAFADEAQMLGFCNDLFGLVDCPHAALRDALADCVGFRHANGKVLLDWQLLYVDLQPHPAESHP